MTETKTIDIRPAGLELHNSAIQMSKDGFTTSEIAEAFGYEPTLIEAMLAEKVELGTPEQILQESLKTIVSLLPLAEMEYRMRPTSTNAGALTGFIDSSKSLINELYNLKNKEETYRQLLQKVLEPFCMEIVQSMLQETGTLRALIKQDELSKFSTNLGKKYQETYRRSRENLADAIGLTAEARIRVNLSANAQSNPNERAATPTTS